VNPSTQPSSSVVLGKKHEISYSIHSLIRSFHSPPHPYLFPVYKIISLIVYCVNFLFSSSITHPRSLNLTDCSLSDLTDTVQISKNLVLFCISHVSFSQISKLVLQTHSMRQFFLSFISSLESYSCIWKMFCAGLHSIRLHCFIKRHFGVLKYFHFSGVCDSRSNAISVTSLVLGE